MTSKVQAKDQRALCRSLLLPAFLLSSFLFSGCAGQASGLNQPHRIAAIAATPAGSTIIAKAADKVIQFGLNSAASSFDNGNPYLHSVADALRSNPDGIIDPAKVQKIFIDYGDPANKSKFKALANDVWEVAKEAAKRFGSETAAELLAKGLQDGAASTLNPYTGP